ncbi:MAG: YidB family protein [Microthrixaceae bacterium]
MTLRDTFGDGSGLLDQLGNHLRTNGLQALLAGFDGAGDEDAAESWVADGPNRPVGPHDVQRALGRDDTEAIAAALGVSPDEAAEGLARVIPAAVDAITPGGVLPTGVQLDALDLRAALAGTDVGALLD